MKPFSDIHINFDFTGIIDSLIRLELIWLQFIHSF